jgi:hypothetical protein
MKRRVYTTLDDETLAELELRAQEADRSVAYLIRVAIDQLLNQLDPTTIDAVSREHPASRRLRCVPDDPYPTPS